MSRAYPYRRPPVDVVATGPWLQVGATTLAELAHELPDWDYDTVLRLRRPLRVDGLRARRSCGLHPDAQLDLSVVWAATSSALRGRAWQAPLPADDDVELEIEIELPGKELGGRLDLETVMTLRTVGTQPGSPATPTRSGSVLWRDVHPLLLQGDAVLLPISVVDFADLIYPTGAAWHLELGHNLDAQALGSILLLVNERREIVTTALASASDPSDADLRVLSMIRTDVVRSLIERALTDEDFDAGEDYPTGSIGALLAAVLRTAFPDRSVDGLKRDRTYNPTLFTTRIQNATALLATP